MCVRVMLLLIILFFSWNSMVAVDNGAENQDWLEGWHSKGGYKMCWNSELWCTLLNQLPYGTKILLSVTYVLHVPKIQKDLYTPPHVCPTIIAHKAVEGCSPAGVVTPPPGSQGQDKFTQLVHSPESRSVRTWEVD